MDTGFIYRMKFKPSMVSDVAMYEFITDVGDGFVEVSTAHLLTAFLEQETKWLTLLTEAITHIDEQADAVRDGLPSGAEILPANLDEADRAGFIAGLRTGARHLSFQLGAAIRSGPKPLPEKSD